MIPSSSSSTYRPTTLRETSPRMIFDEDGNFPPILTPEGQAAVIKILGAHQLIQVSEHYFASRKETGYIFTDEPLSIIRSNCGTLLFCHLNNDIYALESKPFSSGFFKNNYKGIKLNTCEPVCVAIAKTEDCKNEISIVKALSSSTGVGSANICYHLATSTLTDTTYMFTSYANRIDLFRYQETIARKSHKFHLRVARHITRGLVFIHNNGIIHLDIKPHNILVYAQKNSKGKVEFRFRFTDFGTAIHENNSEKKKSIYGTPGYASPEQSRVALIFNSHRQLPESQINPDDLTDAAEKISFSSDIYSLSKTFSFLFPKTGLNSDFWKTQWGNSSRLIHDDPKMRPTAKKCLKHITQDIVRESKRLKTSSQMAP